MTSKTGYWMMATLCAFMPLAHCGGDDRYVVKNNPGAAAPYESWATAAGDIQTAVNAAAEGEPVWVRSSAQWPFQAQRSYRSPGDTVWVRAGVYDAGGTSDVLVGGWKARWKLTNRVAIAKAIVVRSENNDPANTIIKGARSTDGRTNGPDAVRCAYVADGASLIGFTLAGGATLTTNEAWADSTDRSGGGVYARSSLAVISNCIITGNSAFGDPRNSARGGAGACGGKFYNCVFISNATPLRGGGADHAILFNCVLADNFAGINGGGSHGGSLYGCMVSNNTTSGSGGGVAGWSESDPCEVHDSVIIANQAGKDGGGTASHTMLYNCTIAFNVANSAGGAYGSSLINCMVVSNRASSYAGCVGGNIRSNCFILGASLNGKYWNCLIGGSVSSYGVAGNNQTALYNCTVVGNKNSGIGPAISVFNCISWGNGLPDQTVLAINSCGVAGPGNNYADSAAGNITNDPIFLVNGSGFGTNLVPGNYRLQVNSPCANAGFKWGTVDLKDSPRVR